MKVFITCIVILYNLIQLICLPLTGILGVLGALLYLRQQKSDDRFGLWQEVDYCLVINLVSDAILVVSGLVHFMRGGKASQTPVAPVVASEPVPP
jgi:hypothetical protein